VVGTVLLGAVANAADTAPALTEDAGPTFLDKLKKNVGMNYNSFFAGPGIGQPLGLNPGFTGEPSDTGLNFFNLVSVKWKAFERIAFDVQFRSQVVVTNGFEYRHQGQRFGISGKFLKGDDWSFAGAFNSDVPIRGIMGQIPTERTLLFNPGFFSFFDYSPKDSKWSLFALVAPRVWFYRDRQALSRQDALNGGTVNKPEYTVYLNPSVNYAVNDKVGIRLGTTLEYTKFIGFNSIKRNYMPMEVGVTYELSKAFSVYTYLLGSTPLDDGLRRDQGFAANPWYKTISANVWLSGTLF
jgi:hypothetical protein